MDQTTQFRNNKVIASLRIQLIPNQRDLRPNGVSQRNLRLNAVVVYETLISLTFSSFLFSHQTHA